MFRHTGGAAPNGFSAATPARACWKKWQRNIGAGPISKSISASKNKGPRHRARQLDHFTGVLQIALGPAD